LAATVLGFLGDFIWGNYKIVADALLRENALLAYIHAQQAN